MLDRFDLARAALAPAVVDDVLRRASELLTQQVDQLSDQIDVDNPTVAYLGNDTFAVMLPGLVDDVDAVRTAHRLLAGFTLQAISGDFDLSISASIGVAVADEPSAGAEAISAAAGAARRASADGGSRVVVFQPSIDVRAADLLRQEADLRKAIAGDQLRVHYQPLLHVASERVVGVEALVRWEHPERGLLAPFHFIEIAEDSGLVVPLGWWVLRAACEQVRTWQLEVPEAEQLQLSVNLSALQLGQPDAAEQVRRVLDETGLPASSLLLEITETSLNTDPDAARELLRALKALGIRLAIDDFGTGYSTLLQLRNFPVDEIKIDKTFVSSMIDDPGDAAIVTGSVALGRNLGLEVVAEGVESADQLAQLRLAGCDLGQGYHWTKPLAPDEFITWLRSHRSLPDLADQGDHPLGAAADDRPRDEVLGYIAHEIQNSLGVIRGFAELLTDPDEHPADTVDMAGHIARAARQLSNTIGAITDVGVVERGQLHLKFEQVELGELAGQLVREMGEAFGSRSVQVRAESGVRVSVDEAGVSQVLRNLLSNATKFSPPESPIEIDVGTQDGFARVSVRDRGPGVPDSRRPELFRRFSRLGSRHPGTGLGLYLSRLIARAHGGDLIYEPPPDGGAQFVLLIPAPD